MAAGTATPARKKAPAKKAPAATAGKGRATPARPRAARPAPPEDPGVIEPSIVTQDGAMAFVPEAVRDDFSEKVTDEDIAELQKQLESDEGPIGPGGEIRPVKIGKKGKKGPELVTIFEINGVEHKIPKNPTIAVLIQFLRDARVIGRDQAIENLLTSVLGERNLAALASSPEVDAEDVAAVFTIVSHIAFGALANFRKAADPS
jgi:hypothetical protein